MLILLSVLCVCLCLLFVVVSKKNRFLKNNIEMFSMRFAGEDAAELIDAVKRR